MTFWIVNAIVVFLLCVFFAGIVIPQILLIAFRRKLFDEPEERKIHTSAVPRLGGIAFQPVVIFTIVLLLGINALLGKFRLISAIIFDVQEMAFAYCAVVMLYLVGMADDLIGVRYRAKFFVQICSAIMLIAGGLYIQDFHGLFSLHEFPVWFAYPITIFVIVFMINAVNLIDGIDGLCSGLCSVTLAFYGVSFFILQQYLYGMIAFGTLGVLVPFFYYNVFGNAKRGRKIFMGDTGSLTIGIVLCILSLKMLRSVPDISEDQINPMVLAYSPVIIPCFDVIRVYFHRVRNGMNPFMPDKNHIHHKLLATGMPQRWAMVSIVCFAVLLTAMNFFLAHYWNINVLLLIDAFIWIVLNILLSKKIAKIQKTDSDIKKPYV